MNYLYHDFLEYMAKNDGRKLPFWKNNEEEFRGGGGNGYFLVEKGDTIRRVPMEIVLLSGRFPLENYLEYSKKPKEILHKILRTIYYAKEDRFNYYNIYVVEG